MKKRFAVLVVAMFYLAVPVWAIGGGDLSGAKEAGGLWSAVLEAAERIGAWLRMALSPPEPIASTQGEPKTDCQSSIDPNGQCRP